MAIRILIADDSEFMRKLLRKILESHSEFEVEEDVLERSIKAGADGYIIKPYQKDDVIKANNGVN